MQAGTEGAGNPPSLGIRPADRVLVLGATGWFGRTFRALVGQEPSVLALSSRGTPSSVDRCADVITDFRPTVVANFAFLTRDRQEQMPRDEFVAANRELTQRFLYAADQPTVRLSLTVSSGAALNDADLYGRLKAEEETAALQQKTSTRNVAVLRAYSVSGPYVQRPKSYVFSHFVLSAIQGRIHVEANRPVFRRYSAVSDLLKVTLILANQGWSGVLEGGGDLIELRELAERIRSQVNVDATVSHAPHVTDEPEIYASDDVDWMRACRDLGYRPQSLDRQIQSTRDYLLLPSSKS